MTLKSMMFECQHTEDQSTRFSRIGKSLSNGLFLFILLAAFSAAGFGDESAMTAEEQHTKGMALLRGVEKKLSGKGSFHVEFELEDRLRSDETRRYTASADYSDEGILFLVEWPDYGEKCSYLYHEGEVMTYSTNETDVKVFDAHMAFAQRRPILFNPRTIGLSEFPFMGREIIGPALSLDGRAESITVEKLPDEGRSESAYAVTVHSTAPIGKTRKTYTITEPSFHIEKVFFTNESGDFTIEVDNRYDPSVSDLIPAVNKAYRVDTEIVDTDKTLTVKSVENKRFPKDHFTPKSMNIKHNTTFTDYRINRTTGYWHAGRQEIVDHWTDPKEIDAPPPSIPSRNRGPFLRSCCAIGSLVILVILIVRMKRYRERIQAAKRAENGQPGTNEN